MKVLDSHKGRWYYFGQKRYFLVSSPRNISLESAGFKIRRSPKLKRAAGKSTAARPLASAFGRKGLDIQQCRIIPHLLQSRDGASKSLLFLALELHGFDATI